MEEVQNKFGPINSRTSINIKHSQTIFQVINSIQYPE